jgi:nucleotide-binding universal stress UspA family protein
MTLTDPWAERIVVGVDGSEHAERAARWAVQEATTHGRGVTLAYAILPPVTSAAFGPSLPVAVNAIDAIREGAERELSRLADSLSIPDLRTLVVMASSSGLLLEASQTAAMIVMGSRGLGGFRDLLLGSTGTQVATHSLCPCVVIRGLSNPEAAKIVVGIDESPGSEAALAFAFDEASRHSWGLRVIHAFEIPSYDYLVLPDPYQLVSSREVAGEETRLVSELLAGFCSTYPDVQVEQRVVRGPTITSLLEASTDAAMLVVGTRGRGLVLGGILGSTSHGLLHHAKIPVAVIPSKQLPEDS